ncbi:LytR C-terminal domain-containing protein [Demequina aurantiaca]|uniref:LytR C-terminal domain-containing protein n=1 Tax=Demequina aurantiaca TaxID=676200 RepID=UPI003D355BBE
MTQPPIDPTASKRARVRRRRRERQILVFGAIFGGLALAGFFFASVYRGDIEGPFAQPFVTPESAFETEVNIACPPAGVMPMAPTDVSLRVINATNTAGLASTTSKDLSGRGFVVTGSSNWTRDFPGTVRIYYGEEGLAQAYTLSTYFTDFEMVMDTRDSALLDLIIGDDYSAADSLRSQDAAEISTEIAFVRPQQCVPIELVAPEPAPRNLPDDPLASPEPEASPSASASAS